MVAKEERTIKMVDVSACKIIGTETVNITGRDGAMHALEEVQYVLKARYNLIFVRVLHSEGCQIQIQLESSRLAKKTG